MKKLKLFVENFVIYGLGGIISKIIPLLMIPIITRLLPNTEYFGLNDLSNTVVQFGSALAIMGMYDAMYRLFFEKNDENYKKDICSTALLFTLATSIVIFIVMLILKNQIAVLFFDNKKYAYLIYISAVATLVGATNSIISAPTRMQNQRKTYLIANTVSPVLSYAIAIPVILRGYYVIALPLASVISATTMEITFALLNHRWFEPKRFNIHLLRQLLIIAIPLLPNFLIYWVFNSSDKVMITNLISVSAAGIYAVGSKMGHISQLIYTAFAGGWQYFAFSTMKEDNQVQSNSLIFEYLGLISFVAGSYMCVLSHFVFKILFVGDYVQGYIVAPYLFLAPLLQMLFQVACNQFLVIKKTWPNMLILFTGAAINIILNFFLIPILGIEGASIATLFGYIASDVIVTIVLYKMKLMIVSKRFVFSALCLLIYFIIWRLFFMEQTLISLGFAILLTVIYGMLYIDDVKKLISGLKN